MEVASFTRMEDGTKEEYEFLTKLEHKGAEGVVDRLLNELKGIKDYATGYKLDRLGHSLQSATRAFRDGRDEEYVVVALLHDVGDGLAPFNHSEFVAALMRPYISEENYWMLKYHGLFQAYYYAHHFGDDRNARDAHKDHPCYDATVEFCHIYDQNCFDPDYENLTLEFFEPMVRRIFARKPFSLYDIANRG